MINERMGQVLVKLQVSFIFGWLLFLFLIKDKVKDHLDNSMTERQIGTGFGSVHYS